MRKIMEDKTRSLEVFKEEENGRTQVADRLIERWSRKAGLGLDNGGFAKIYESNPRVARNLATVLENQERHLKSLTETQTSAAFNATPQTIVKVIRLGYPNSVRGEIFTEWAMQTMKDSFYKVETTYDSTARGATAGDVTYESTASDYASETMEDIAPSATGTTVTGTASVFPIRPFTVQVFLNNKPIAVDNGAGVFVGAALGATPSVIDYSTNGQYTIHLAEAIASSDVVVVRFAYNSEIESLYSKQGLTNINLVAYDFKAKVYPLGFSWSKMTELAMDSSLSLDAEEILMMSGADELKKALDFQAIKLGYRGAHWTTAEEFNTNWAAAGADSDYAHTQSVTKALRNASQKTYSALMRGGEATSYVAGPKAVTYLTQHKLYVPENAPVAVGAYKVGSLGGIPVYQSPSDIVPTDEVMCVYKNNREESNDSALVTASFVPFYKSQTIEYRNLYKENAIAFFGDMRLQEPKYLTRVKLTGL